MLVLKIELKFCVYVMGWWWGIRGNCTNPHMTYFFNSTNEGDSAHSIFSTIFKKIIIKSTAYSRVLVNYKNMSHSCSNQTVNEY